MTDQELGRKPTTKEKALRINLNPTHYGSFAEIGAGQEVAANFFKAGGASGTIAKTMSAYDMAFSDAIYGRSSRYVSQDRLIRMLEKEYSLLPERLPNRVDDTRFFAYANTIEALNFKKTNQGQGWMGIRFQLTPEGPCNECVIHIYLHDSDSIWQQQAIGIVGVNLIYGCLYYHDEPKKLLLSLVENLNVGRVEVDMFRISGPDFEGVDHRLLSLQMVRHKLTNVAMFDKNGQVMQAADNLYKKNTLILRGRFRPVTHVNLDMMKNGYQRFIAEDDVEESNTVQIAELTLGNLEASGQIDDKDFLDRVDILCSLGQTVMISSFTEYYKLIRFLCRFNRRRKIGIVLGIYNLANIFDEAYYQNLEGGILEAFGILFGTNIKLYVYPSFKRNCPPGEEDLLYNCDNFQLPFQLYSLFRYVYDNEKIEDMAVAEREHLRIVSDNVLAMIKRGEDGWEAMVPPEVAEAIKEKCLFEYPCEFPKKMEADANNPNANTTNANNNNGTVEAVGAAKKAELLENDD